jgi:hypothetical protein
MSALPITTYNFIISQTASFLEANTDGRQTRTDRPRRIHRHTYVTPHTIFFTNTNHGHDHDGGGDDGYIYINDTQVNNISSNTIIITIIIA